MEYVYIAFELATQSLQNLCGVNFHVFFTAVRNDSFPQDEHGHVAFITEKLAGRISM